MTERNRIQKELKDLGIVKHLPQNYTLVRNNITKSQVSSKMPVLVTERETSKTRSFFQIPKLEYDQPVSSKPRLSKGQLGYAFERVQTDLSIPDVVIVALNSSPTFRERAKIIDKKYVSMENWQSDWVMDPVKGILTNGKFKGRSVKGRRVLGVLGAFNVRPFELALSIENGAESDMIFLAQPPASFTSEPEKIRWWIFVLTYQMFNAWKEVTAKRLPTKSIAVKIIRAIQEQAQIRKDVDMIAKQIDSINKSLRVGIVFEGFYFEEAVEKDFFPMGLIFPPEMIRTSLEYFALKELMTKAAANEKLTRDEIDKLNAKMDALPLTNLDSYLKAPFPVFIDNKGVQNPIDSQYAGYRLIQRVIHARWRLVPNLESLDTKTDSDLYEIRFQHEDAFFKDIIKYAIRRNS